MTRVKMCGLRRKEDVAFVNQVQPDYAGFVLAPGKRQVSIGQLRILLEDLADGILSIAVVQNPEELFLEELAGLEKLGGIQFHGEESPALIQRIHREHPSLLLVKAVPMTTPHRISFWEREPVDYLLLDSGRGGTGEVFDWSLVDNMDKPFFLAGIKLLSPYGVDVSSGIEVEGKKDLARMEAFIRRVKHGKR